MSVNQINVNAVNERLRNEDHDQYGKVMDKLTQDDQTFREMALTAAMDIGLTEDEAERAVDDMNL